MPSGRLRLISSSFFSTAWGNGTAVFTDQHMHCADNHLFTILRSGAIAQFLAYKDIGNVFNAWGFPTWNRE